MSLSDASKAPAPRWAIGLFLVFLGAIALIGSRDAVNPIDFYQFWFVSQTELHGVERPYSRNDQAKLSAAATTRLNAETTGELEARTLSETRRLFQPLADGRMIQSTGTPLLYAMAAMISTDSFETSGRFAHAVIMLSYVVSLMLLGRLLKLSNIAILGCWFAIWTLFLPVSFDAYFGNVAGVQLAMLLGCVCCLTDRRFFLAGMIGAIAALFKPLAAYPVIALSVFVVAAGDWRATARFVFGGLSGGVLSLAMTAMVFGTTVVWIDWFTLMLPQVAETSYLLVNGNVGLNSLLFEWTGYRHTAVLTSLTFLPVLVASFVAGRASFRSVDQSPELAQDLVPLHIMNGAAAAMLLSAPLTWHHYYVLLLPGLVVAASCANVRGRVAAGIALVCLSRLGFLGIGETGVARAAFSASLCVIGAAALFASAMLVIVQRSGLGLAGACGFFPRGTVTSQRREIAC